MRQGTACLALASALLCAPASPGADIGLAEAIDLALGSSPALRNGRYDSWLASERYKLGLRKFFPSLNISYAQNDSVVYRGQDSRLKRLSLGVDQLLYDRGELDRARSMELINLNLAGRRIRQSEAAAARAVVDLFTEIIAFRVQTAVLRATLANAGGQRALAREELRLGEITELELVQIDIQVKDLEIQVACSDQQARRLAFSLSRLLGLPHDRGLDPRGEIRSDFTGFLERFDPEYYLEQARGRGLEFEERRAGLIDARKNLERAEQEWIPGLRASLELSMSGERFPLDRPGFSAGLTFDFALPVLPADAAFTAGRQNSLERSLGASASLRPGDNLEGLQSRGTAGLALRKTADDSEDFEKQLDFSVREELATIAAERTTLGLLVEKERLSERQRALEALQLELGELTRIEFVKSEIERARLKMEKTSAQTGLFRREADLLELCGMEGVEASYFSFIREMEDEP